MKEEKKGGKKSCLPEDEAEPPLSRGELSPPVCGAAPSCGVSASTARSSAPVQEGRARPYTGGRGGGGRCVHSCRVSLMSCRQSTSPLV